MNLISKLMNKYTATKTQVEHKLYWDHIPRQVAPSIIEEFPTHLLINKEIFVKCIVVGVPHMKVEGYPRDMNPRLIDELLGLSTQGFTISYSLTAIPISTAESMRMLDSAMFYNRVNQEETKQHNMGQPSMKLVLDQEDFQENYRNLHKNQQKMFHTAFIITIWARSDEELRKAESHVRTIFEANIVHYEFPYMRMLDAFIAAQPYPTSADFAWVELFSHHVSSLAATRNPNSRTQETGLYFGDDLKTGKNIQIDLKALAAQHLMFVGPTGSGKTFTLLMLLMRAYDMLGKRVIYTTPKADVGTNYRAVAAYYGKSAEIIDIGPSGKNINPLEIMYDPVILGNSAQAYCRAFDNHMELLNQFFSVLFEGTKTINMANYINESLMEVYKQKGISRENPETWKGAKWPTLLDVRQIWLAEREDNVTAKALVDKTFMVNTAWAYMNQPTNINLSADFIIVDISDVPESLKDAMNVFVTGIMGLRFKTDAKKETIIATDEAAVFLRNPQLALFLLKTLTQGRSFNIALWLATQQTADLVKAGVSEEFKTNLSISIVLGNMRKDTLEHVRSFYKLNETDINNLMSCGVGEGLLLVGNEVIPTKFKPTEHEIGVIKGTQAQGKIPSADGGIQLVHEALGILAVQNGIYFDDWIKGSSDSTILSRQGFEARKVQRAVGIGTVRAWIKSDILQGDMIGNQSIDHYSTVLQIAGYLCRHGIPVEIYHSSDCDIVANINNSRIAFEYERPGSHDTAALIRKKEFAETKYGKVIFIGTAENIKLLYEATGDCAVKRGSQLIEMLDSIISSKKDDI